MTSGRGSIRSKAALVSAAILAPACIALAAGLAASSASAHVRYACTGPGSAHVPCRFATPSGDVHCLWTPSSAAVVCELMATGRGYELRPRGHARSVSPHLVRRGEELPTSQQIVFPHSLSCTDTRTTITCNQDFAGGYFKLGPNVARSR